MTLAGLRLVQGQTHWDGSPPIAQHAPEPTGVQVNPLGQVPQDTVPPQPLGMSPQSRPSQACHWGSGVQQVPALQTLPPLQLQSAGQLAQSSPLPQVPLPQGLVDTHLLLVQVCPVLQLPQLPPQPFEPQSLLVQFGVQQEEP